MSANTPIDTERDVHRSQRQSSNGQGENLQPATDAIDYLKAYARERPEVAALWCVGIGFILGWKLKPW